MDEAPAGPPERGSTPRHALVHGTSPVASYALVVFAAAWLAFLWAPRTAPHPAAILVPLLEDVDGIGDVGSWPALAAIDVRGGEIGTVVRADGVSEVEGRRAVAAAQHVLAAWQRDVPPAWASRLQAIVVHSDGTQGWTAAMGRGDTLALHVDVDDLTRVVSPPVVLHEFAHLVGSLDGDPTAERAVPPDEGPCLLWCRESLESQFALRFWHDVDVRGLPHPHAPGASDAARARIEEAPGAFIEDGAAYGPVEDFAVTLSAAILIRIGPSRYEPPHPDGTVTFLEKLDWLLDQPRLAEVVESTIAHRAELGPLPRPDGSVPHA